MLNLHLKRTHKLHAEWFSNDYYTCFLVLLKRKNSQSTKSYGLQFQKMPIPCTCTSYGVLDLSCTRLIVPVCKNEVSNPPYMSLPPLSSLCSPYHIRQQNRKIFNAAKDEKRKHVRCDDLTNYTPHILMPSLTATPTTIHKIHIAGSVLHTHSQAICCC